MWFATITAPCAGSPRDSTFTASTRNDRRQVSCNHRALLTASLRFDPHTAYVTAPHAITENNATSRPAPRTLFQSVAIVVSAPEQTHPMNLRNTRAGIACKSIHVKKSMVLNSRSIAGSPHTAAPAAR
ncbi:hypothetical protein RAHE111665_15550 [Rariglobus hedericola]